MPRVTSPSSPLSLFLRLRTQLRAQKVAVLLTLICAVFLPGADCVPRECASNANCARVCECTDTQANQTFQCPLTYLCAEGNTCEEQIFESCDEMCGRIAARGLCGTQRCNDETDCDRSVQCVATDQNGNQTSFACERRFDCDIDVGVCEVDYSVLTDDQVCQLCASGA